MDLYPDTNILLFYFENENNSVDLIFNCEKFNVLILPSIQMEYERRMNIKEINTIQEQLYEVNNITNSGLKIKMKIQEILNEKNSIYLKELQRKIETINNPNEILSLSHQLKTEFRNLMGVIAIKYVSNLEADKINVYKQNNCPFVDVLHKMLKEYFPEEKDNDKYDNEHIINAVILTKLRKNQLSYFVSDDNFRRHYNTNKYYIEASSDIKKNFQVNLELKHFPEFVKELKSK